MRKSLFLLICLIGTASALQLQRQPEPSDPVKDNGDVLKCILCEMFAQWIEQGIGDTLSASEPKIIALCEQALGQNNPLVGKVICEAILKDIMDDIFALLSDEHHAAVDAKNLCTNLLHMCPPDDDGKRKMIEGYLGELLKKKGAEKLIVAL